MVVLGAARLRGLDRDDAHDVAVVALGSGTLVSLLWSFNVFNGWADAMFMLPLAAAGLGGRRARGRPAGPGARGGRRRRDVRRRGDRGRGRQRVGRPATTGSSR